MSHASEHPQHCARQADLGCQETARSGKWGRIAAQESGWFFSREGGLAYCPAHVPKWVAGWRARKNARS